MLCLLWLWSNQKLFNFLPYSPPPPLLSETITVALFLLTESSFNQEFPCVTFHDVLPKNFLMEQKITLYYCFIIIMIHL